VFSVCEMAHNEADPGGEAAYQDLDQAITSSF
jgi:hypothetical protein